MARFIIDTTNGPVEVDGEQIDGLPLFVHQDICKDGTVAYSVNHIATGLNLPVGYDTQDSAINGIRCWWEVLDPDIRQILRETKTRGKWIALMRDRTDLLRREILAETRDFRWVQHPECSSGLEQ